jgi:hypothetical protein
MTPPADKPMPRKKKDSPGRPWTVAQALNAVLGEYAQVREEHGYLVTYTAAMKLGYEALRQSSRRTK